MRSNNGALLSWAFRLVEETNTLDHIKPHVTLLLFNSCFKPNLLKPTWNKLNSWGLLQPALRSKVTIWGQTCGFLTILCYANCKLSHLDNIPNEFLLDSFFGKNALHYSIEHNNLKSTEQLLINKVTAKRLLNDIQRYSRCSALEIAKQSQCDEKVINVVIKRSKNLYC